MDIQKIYQIFLKSGKASTDTRQITPGAVFFALRGEKFDGNLFAADALAKGAALAVVDNPSVAKDDRYVVVEDALKTLQDVARHHRRHLTIPVIGLTGSNGKTTSKELLAAVLGTRFRTFATRGNLNNHIGVPLSVLSIDPSVEVAIIEMGANHLGEIALLSSIAQPTHGFITNIGKAHIGTFGGFENIIRGKSELYQYLIAHEGVVFINSENEVLFNMAKRFKQPLFYPGKKDYCPVALLGADPFIEFETETGERVKTQLIGKYNFENVAVALCIGKYFGVDAVAAAQAVANYVPANMRSQIIRKETNTVILDAYNANPSSMAAALTNLAEMKAERKVVILGDMFELEEDAETEHRHIGRLLHEFGFTEVYLCGSLMQYAQQEFPKARHFYTRDDLLEALRRNPIIHSTVLVKASRGIGLEVVLDTL